MSNQPSNLPRVYVETSVLGYLTSWPSGDLIVASRQKLTRDWWCEVAVAYELMVSDLVVREASMGDAEAVEDRLKAIAALPVLQSTQEAQDLASALMNAGAIPPTEMADALHIAIAVVNGIEYLVTWNFKHIANATMRSKIQEVCSTEGYVISTICTPEELGEE